jgi:predicted RNA binding protein YcfA (HicA-like mRNA interferase family)
MPRLAPIHWKKFEKFLFYVGCHLERERGDHRVYTREGLQRPLVIPRDAQLPLFIIRNNLRVLGISTKEYLEVLERLK